MLFRYTNIGLRRAKQIYEYSIYRKCPVKTLSSKNSHGDMRGIEHQINLNVVFCYSSYPDM